MCDGLLMWLSWLPCVVILCRRLVVTVVRRLDWCRCRIVAVVLVRLLLMDIGIRPRYVRFAMVWWLGRILCL